MNPKFNAFLLGLTLILMSGKAIVWAGSYEGRLEISIAEDFAGFVEHRFHLVTQDGNKRRIQFQGSEAGGSTNLHTGSRIRIFAGQSGKGLMMQGSSSASIQVLEAAAASSSSGPKRLLFIIAHSPTTSPPITAAAGQANLTTVNNYYQEASYGQTSIVGDVAGPFAVLNNTQINTCDYTGIMSAAENAAAGAGISLNQYQMAQVIFPATNGCQWTGLAELGGMGSVRRKTWINGPTASPAVLALVSAHEIGHNFGVGHAASLHCGSMPFDPNASNCTAAPYGDKYNVMGNVSMMHFNSLHKSSLNWMTLQTVSNPGIYTLSPLETSGSALTFNSNLGANYYITTIEFRRPIGFDSNPSAGSNVFQGVLIHTGSYNGYPSGDAGASLILDMNSATRYAADEALVVGQTYTDPGSKGYTVSVLSVNSTSAQIEIRTNSSPDPTPPTVSITAPSNGATVSGTTNVTANASDNVGVVGVQFKLNGANLGTEDTTAPYSVSWNTTLNTNSAHSLIAVARDAAGNNATSTAVNVTVSNSALPPPADSQAPTVSITSPAAGATVSSPLDVAANAFDNVGVAGVQFKLNGTNLGPEVTVAPYFLSIYTGSIPNGSHSLTAVARDAAGNTATSPVVNFTVNKNPDTTPPTVSITAPANGATVSGTLNVTANASDNVGVAGVQFKLNGANLGTEDTTAPYSVSWNTTLNTNSAHSLIAVARDAAGNNATSTAVNVTVSNSALPPPSTTYSLSASPVTVSTGGTITVSWTAPQGRPSTDWIGLYPVTVPAKSDMAYVSYQYTGGLVSGQKSFTAPPTEGQYEFRYFVDNGYTRKAVSNPIQVKIGSTPPPPPDSQVPTVSITAPANGATVSGTLNVTANASDNVGVVGVQFKLNGANLGTEDTTAPYSVSWNTTLNTNSAHSLIAVARDATGNNATSTAVNVTVSNSAPPPPSTTYSLSASPVTVSTGGTITVSWTAPQGRPSTDWIGLYPVTVPAKSDLTYISWQYTGGLVSGRKLFTAPSTEGRYEFRYFLENGYTRTAVSNPIQVSKLLQVGMDTPLPPITNTAPVANNQSETTNQDTSLAITLIGSDTGNDPLAWIIVSHPAHGMLTGSESNWTYIPSAGFFGTDSFAFKVFDGTIDSNVAVVTINIKSRPAHQTNSDPITLIKNVINSTRGEKVAFELGETRGTSVISVTVYDRLGYKVREFQQDSDAGSTIVNWNGQNDSGQMVVSGSYLMVLKCGENTFKQKVVVMK